MFIKDDILNNSVWSETERAQKAMAVKMQLYPKGISHLSALEQEACNRKIENEVNRLQTEYFNLLKRNGRL